MHKIYSVLIAQQKNPELIKIIATEEPSDAKTQKIESTIQSTYSKYHEYYFRHSFLKSIQNYGGAKQAVIEAQIFDDIMEIREKAKSAGQKELMIGNRNLLDDRYEISGESQNPKSKSNFPPHELIELYKTSILENIDNKEVPNLMKNLDSMETPYLLRLYAQMNLALTDEASRKIFANDPSLAEAFSGHMSLIRNYLTCKRNIHINTAIGNPDFFTPKMPVETIIKHLESLTDDQGSIAYKEFEKVKYDCKPSVYALYKLAQYFGYNGEPREKALQEYLNEDSANHHGVYWDGEGWYLQERGMELDDFMGKDLNKETIDAIINRMKEQPDNIFEHRNDTLISDAYDFTSQVQKMTRALEEGYKAGEVKFSTEKQPVAAAA